MLESTWTTDLAPDGPPSSESFFFLRGTQTDTLEVLFLAMAGRRDCVLEADTCQSWQLRILARFFPPMCSALLRLRITSHAEDLPISLVLNKATEERLHAYSDRLPHPISLVHIAISWVLPLRVSTCHYKCMYICLGFVRYDHGLILHGLYFSIAKRLENDFIWPKIQCPWKWYLETLTFSSLY